MFFCSFFLSSVFLVCSPSSSPKKLVFSLPHSDPTFGPPPSGLSRLQASRPQALFVFVFCLKGGQICPCLGSGAPNGPWKGQAQRNEIQLTTPRHTVCTQEKQCTVCTHAHRVCCQHVHAEHQQRDQIGRCSYSNGKARVTLRATVTAASSREWHMSDRQRVQLQLRRRVEDAMNIVSAIAITVKTRELLSLRLIRRLRFGTVDSVNKDPATPRKKRNTLRL